jgi:hypothetical protein
MNDPLTVSDLIVSCGMILHAIAVIMALVSFKIIHPSMRKGWTFFILGLLFVLVRRGTGLLEAMSTHPVLNRDISGAMTVFVTVSMILFIHEVGKHGGHH